MWLYGTKRLTHRTQARELLLTGAKQVWGFSALPAVERQEGGKPFFPSHPTCQFNLSHSGTLALCALDDRPVGVDIQIVKTNWRENLPKRVGSELELEWLNAQPDRWAAFALLWSLKESRVKQSGLGLRMSIPSIRVPLPEAGREQYELDGLWFHIYKGMDWAGAVCGEQEPPGGIIWM